MDLREQRGMELAATRTIRQKGGSWIVPSQTGNGSYRVHLMPKIASCTCPDFETRRANCKHIFAATFVMRREQNADGSVTVTRAMMLSETKTTYPQDWSAYNSAQTNEKDRFQVLLADLCKGISNPEPNKTGRPRLPLSDAIFSAAFKVYSTVSGRRFMSDLRGAEEKGFISKTPHYNSIFNYLENPELTPILRALITESSLPLKSVEVNFAVDSSGFSTSRFVRWFDHKYGTVREQHDWVKCHLMCGVKTNIVTAVEIHDRNANDSPILPTLCAATAHNFQLAEVSADKGYASRVNTDAVASLGATPFISFATHHRGNGGGTWEKMYHYFQFKREDFLQHYHKRSNVESTSSMMKRKFGDGLRSKTDVAMVNETLCKVLCHNLVVLIHEMYELGIDPVFWSGDVGSV